ncbi:polysaccharide pyruvyl transferase WcaK-like protein [Prauserella shujinwangii]|uniref:Polysaccharide pyruvyl transferase WcaK-like protein n=1 Tax=Prauserella shujinwangii TaxID=1453103 RepID=A0A2T0LQJ1_9PSEU|nr:polysaccharide pyruvyl transferase family protein [Prauserella shujinwangii]PRX45618.1 polysaccharide pyruvyl transferase WcaK-like protein [Prauserella shujinwangii]
MSQSVRIGLFGLLGSGNLGNDGSFEAVLARLRAEHPDALLDCLCAGPGEVTARYGLPAAPLNWYRGEYETVSGVRSVVLKLVGKLADAVRTAAWVRGHDAVIVPGMGVLEATLPLRPWGFPYSLFLLCAAGRVFGTRVALVSVGADRVNARATRWLITRAAALATYRSYRDELSRTALRRMGVDTSADDVYPDLAFALPAPAAAAPNGTVGVGVIDFHGSDDERAEADALYAAYLARMKRFVGKLVADGRPVRLFTGDVADQAVVDALRAEIDSPLLSAARTTTIGELLREMSTVDVVVASRYHNVLSALRLGKPTLSISYAAKNDELMADLGVGEFRQPIRTLDVGLLLAQLADLEARSDRVRATLAGRNAELTRALDRQFAALSAALFPHTTSEEAR